MRSTLVIISPAGDLQLLTIEEMRSLAGLGDNTQDPALELLGLRTAATIASECNVAIGQGGEPTLLEEEIEETFRRINSRVLLLSRRHNVEILSVVVDDLTLSGDEYDVDPESGIVERLKDFSPIWWTGRNIVVRYKAGFDEVPPDLSMAAADFFRLSWLESRRDPSVKSQTVEIADIETIRTELWAGALPGGVQGSALPASVIGFLKRFRNASIS